MREIACPLGLALSPGGLAAIGDPPLVYHNTQGLGAQRKQRSLSSNTGSAGKRGGVRAPFRHLHSMPCEKAERRGRPDAHQATGLVSRVFWARDRAAANVG